MPVHIPDTNTALLASRGNRAVSAPGCPQPGQLPGNEDPRTFWAGKWLLLKTDPEDPPCRHAVTSCAWSRSSPRLIHCVWTKTRSHEITRIKWEDEQALPFEMCLFDMMVRGNLVYATAGETMREFFTIGTNTNIPPTQQTDIGRAVERQGALNDVTGERSVTFLYSLKQTETRGLGWLGDFA